MLKFEGEYFNGKRNGRGKEYYENGKLEFEGLFSSDIRNDKGKEYYENGKLNLKENIYMKKNGMEKDMI